MSDGQHSFRINIRKELRVLDTLKPRIPDAVLRYIESFLDKENDVTEFCSTMAGEAKVKYFPLALSEDQRLRVCKAFGTAQEGDCIVDGVFQRYKKALRGEIERVTRILRKVGYPGTIPEEPDVDIELRLLHELTNAQIRRANRSIDPSLRRPEVDFNHVLNAEFPDRRPSCQLEQYQAVTDTSDDVD
jgi:hypothetical protein